MERPHRSMYKLCTGAELHAPVQALTPPAGWEITEKAGSSKVSLTRDYGEEVVQVDFTAREYVSQAPTVLQPHVYMPTPCWARYLSLFPEL